jgi:predicted CXXCH cytochrome family protein
MRLGPSLLVAMALVWSALVATVAARQQSPAAPRESSLAPAAIAPQSPSTTLADAGVAGGPSGDYVGSDACKRCHEVEHGQWQRSLHIQMTKPIAEAKILGDFTEGTRLSESGRSYEFSRSNGAPVMRIAFGDRAPETFTVDYTLGAKRYQGYLSKLADGRMYVLPAFWQVETRRWIDWKEITPVPDGAHDLRQIWNANCFNCHATNLAQGYDIQAKLYRTTWSEMGIGCEACHGPGREHVAIADGWEKNPASKPADIASSTDPALTDRLKALSTRTAIPRRTFDTCAYCHGNKTNVFVGFKAGDRYEDYALPFLLSDEIPANDLQGEFWPDGRPNRFNRPQALMQSGCFMAGAIACTNCHVAHGSRYEHSLKVNIYEGRYGDTLCTQCHQEQQSAPGALRLPGNREGAGAASGVQGTGADPTRSFTTAEGLKAHTFHAPESAGSRCIACHMSDVNWRMLVRRRDHTFRAPNPEMTARYGIPNACTTCHDDKTPEWAARQMDAWWGDRARRQKAVTMADVLYRAGSGDVTVLPELGRLSIDRTQGSLIRASAADYIARMLLGNYVEGHGLGQSQTAYVSGKGQATSRREVPPNAVTPEVVNMLIAAAADPEAIVRASAIRALAATGQTERVTPPLTARLIDSARVVRVRAAEALLTLGFGVLPGAAGAALVKAQDEYAASLEAFPDVAANHASRAWLESERGRVDEAQKALDEAIQVDPNFARPYVVKGVLAARAGRFQEAVDLWKKARSIEPGYPRIDALIAEAEKRKAGAR